MNYLFKIGWGFGNIPFDATESEVLNLLGEPDKIERDVYVNENEDIKDETVDYYYDKIGLSFKFFYFNNELDEMAIFTNKLIYNDENWFSLSKRTILKTIKEIYKERNLVYSYKIEKYNIYDLKIDNYGFDAIGLTIWFENNKLDDLCINKPSNFSLSVSQPKPYVFAEPSAEMIAAEPEVTYNKTIC